MNEKSGVTMKRERERRKLMEMTRQRKAKKTTGRNTKDEGS